MSADYHRRALELLPADSPRRAEALASQARALHIGARPREAAAVGRDALRALPPGPSAAATAAIVVNDLYLDGRSTTRSTVIDAELGRRRRACPLLAMRANLLLQAGRYAEASASVRRTRSAASMTGSVTPAAELMALAHLVQYANHVGQVGRATDLLCRVEALAERASRTVSLAAHELVAFADWRPGLLARIEEHLGAAAAMRPEGAAVSIGGSSESVRVRVLWMRGEWDEALGLIGSTGFDLEQRGAVASAQLLACAACEIHVDRGDVDAAVAALRVDDDTILSVRRHAALAQARLHQALGEPDVALGVLDRERAKASTPGGSVWKHAEMLPARRRHPRRGGTCRRSAECRGRARGAGRAHRMDRMPGAGASGPGPRRPGRRCRPRLPRPGRSRGLGGRARACAPGARRARRRHRRGTSTRHTRRSMRSARHPGGGGQRRGSAPRG